MNDRIKRAYLRFGADPNTVAWICSKAEVAEFKPEQVALVMNESYTGCCFVTVAKPVLEDGQTFTIKSGQMAVMRAVARWSKEISAGVWQVGCEVELS